MNLGDPELEILDPTPNVHALFLHFDQVFFSTKLSSRAVVRWSKRMYSCAGICTYEGRAGFCDIALSEPLLKLRPRKNLIETLLHEMIHAFLFVTGNDRDRDGHGPKFQAHMHRINKAAGINITIYHDFHDEVRLYQTHWWRCNGPCKDWRPFFGTVRKTRNQAPGPTDNWWNDHQRKCGGKFIKIKEPENKRKPVKGKGKAKPKLGDITKFINNNNNTSLDNNTKVTAPAKIPNFKGPGHILNKTSSSKSVDISETVRNVWINKALPKTNSVNDITNKVREVWANKQLNKETKVNNKRHSVDSNIKSPPLKITKIDDYFKNKAQDILKDVYGTNFSVHQNNETNKLIAIQDSNNDRKNIDTNKSKAIQNFNEENVNCPICNDRVESSKINNHVDECLNKQEIQRLVKNEPIVIPSTSQINNKDKNSVQQDMKNLAEVIKKESGITQNISQVDFIDITIKKEDTTNLNIKVNAVSSTNIDDTNTLNCPCCDTIVNTSMEDHIEECLSFFYNDTTTPKLDDKIETVILDDDDDDLDESQTYNATGTKSPCPVCLQMIEQAEMNEHLDECLNKD